MNPPRLGFLGVGWIGLDRMKALRATGAGDIAALCDPSDEAIGRVRALVPDVRVVDSLDAMLDLGLDGIVIATPSAHHAEQCVATLDAGHAVFCQKPLGRTSAEVRAIVEAARRADRLVGVDLSYRHTRALVAVRKLVTSGDLGRVYAADLVFHNAYGPDKAWYRDREQSGGGCVMDLGIHLVDAALWTLGFPAVEEVRSTRWAQGRRLAAAEPVNEEYAVAEIHLAGGTVVRLSCSWWLQAGHDAEIVADFWGTDGAARFHNLEGSFYDFVADRCRGTTTERVVSPPDSWGGRTLVTWAKQLAAEQWFDPEIERQIPVAEVLDAIYAPERGRL